MSTTHALDCRGDGFMKLVRVLCEGDTQLFCAAVTPPLSVCTSNRCHVIDLLGSVQGRNNDREKR